MPSSPRNENENTLPEESWTVGRSPYILFGIALVVILGISAVAFKSQQKAIEGASRPSTPTTQRRIEARVLLVDDHLINIKVGLALLKKIGCEVTVARNGSQAIEMWTQGSFDLILMDLQMPVMGGLEATQRIREMEKESGTHVPIVAITARAMKEDQEMCLRSGMDGYLSKPIRPAELRETLEQWMPEIPASK